MSPSGSPPTSRLLEVLAREVHRRHPSIDRTFASLAALLEVEAPGLAEVRERLRKDDSRRREFREHGLLGRPSADAATIALELECPKCGDTNHYDVKKVLVDLELPGAKPFVANELTCLSCGQDSDLRLGGQGHLALTAELMRRKMAGDQKRPYASPIQIVRMLIEGGRRVGPAEAIAHYEALIERSPLSAEAWLGLGNCLANVGRERRAIRLAWHRPCPWLGGKAAAMTPASATAATSSRSAAADPEARASTRHCSLGRRNSHREVVAHIRDASIRLISIPPQPIATLAVSAWHARCYRGSLPLLMRLHAPTSANAGEIEELSFADLIRLGNRRGLPQSEWETWRRYRKQRGTTSHTYDPRKAAEVLVDLPGFLVDAQYLLARLRDRGAAT